MLVSENDAKARDKKTILKVNSNSLSKIRYEVDNFIQLKGSTTCCVNQFTHNCNDYCFVGMKLIILVI